jgi:hypothetical protein
MWKPVLGGYQKKELRNRSGVENGSHLACFRVSSSKVVPFLKPASQFSMS